MKHVIALMFIVGLSFSTLLAQTDWTHVTDEPVLGYGAPDTWDDGSVFTPAVIKDGDTLRMWYSGWDGDLFPFNTAQVGYAWSTDGILWHRHEGNPVMSTDQPWEGSTIAGIAVIKEGDSLKMWYGANSAPPFLVGYATSIDGIHWNKYPDPVLSRGRPFEDWDAAFISPHTVIKTDNEYMMWYYAGDDAFPNSVIQIGLAFSFDGITWVKHDDVSTTAAPFANSDPVLGVGPSGTWDRQRVWSGTVLKSEAGYEMWYAGAPQFSGVPQWIGYATSEDGIAWTKWPDNPIVESAPAWGSWYFCGTVLRFDELYHHWYTSFDNNGGRPRVGYMISPVTPSAVELPTTAESMPREFDLLQNYPNPFNPETVIRFSLPQRSEVEITIHNQLGQPVRRLATNEFGAGSHHLRWNGRDESGEIVPSGIYFYRIQANAGASTFTSTRKMVLVR